MEYMERGLLADKLRDQKPLSDNSVFSYLAQILEGVFFSPKKNIPRPQRYKACKYAILYGG